MNFKIRLVSVASMNNAIGIDPEQVIFENTPVLTESGPVEYTDPYARINSGVQKHQLKDIYD